MYDDKNLKFGETSTYLMKQQCDVSSNNVKILRVLESGMGKMFSIML